MTTADHLWASEPGSALLASVPELRRDFERRDIDDETVVWSPLVPFPTALDPVASVMLDVIDGSASISDLAADVHETVAIPLPDAERQVIRVVDLFAATGLLTTSTSSATAEEVISSREVFLSNSTPCAESASRLGTEVLFLRFGGNVVRVACDSRRAARQLRAALGEHAVDPTDDAPLAFLLTAPQGLQRHHRLEDRSGFVLSEARGLDSGLSALASHLTALLPPAAGTVRIQARAVTLGDRTTVCLPPLFYFPPMSEAALKAQGVRVVDRLAMDIEVESGAVANPDVPWPALAGLRTDPLHLGTGGTRTVDVIMVLAGEGSPPPTSAAAVAQVASSGLSGSTGDVLDAAIKLVDQAEIRPTTADERHFLNALTG